MFFCLYVCLFYLVTKAEFLAAFNLMGAWGAKACIDNI